MAYYFISLGSNINPKLNFSLMIDKLLTLSKEVVLSRVIETTAAVWQRQTSMTMAT